MRPFSDNRLRPLAKVLMVALSLVLLPCMPLESATAEPMQGSGFRIYRERNAQGEEVLHITNLDETGRRIGGELEHKAVPSDTNPVCRYEEATAAPPVVINLYSYPQPPAGPEEPQSYIGSDAFYPSYGYAGYARTPAPYWRPAGGHHRSRQPDGLFGRQRAIDTRPYTRATASQRNQATFHRH